MSDRPQGSNSKSAISDNTRSTHFKLGPVESSVLEYVLFVHGNDVNRRACLVALLLHAQLLARGARPTTTDGGRSSAVLSQPTLANDPIRLSYTLVPRLNSETLASASSQLQLSVAETDSHIFASLTDTTTDKFGHLELPGEHIRLDCTAECLQGDFQFVFPQLSDLLDLVEDKLWKSVLPSPPLQRTGETDRRKEKKEPQFIPDDFQPPRFYPSPYGGSRPGTSGGAFPDYGRSDLDPLSGLTGPGSGGMILDPRRPILGGGLGGGSLLGGPDVLPPGSVPSGARFDPFGPGVMPPRPQFGRPRAPDPDHALPPGYDDMYL